MNVIYTIVIKPSLLIPTGAAVILVGILFPPCVALLSPVVVLVFVVVLVLLLVEIKDSVKYKTQQLKT